MCPDLEQWERTLAGLGLRCGSSVSPEECECQSSFQHDSDSFSQLMPALHACITSPPVYIREQYIYVTVYYLSIA